MMKIGVISDTHGEVGLTREALNVLDALQVDLTLHCGDVGLEVMRLLAGRQVHFVAGNTDNLESLHAAMIDPKHTFHGQVGELELEGCRVAFLHGHDVKLLRQTIQSGRYDLVCHGHSHSFSSSTTGTTLVLNPGALSRTRSPSVAIVELPSIEVTQIPL
jgi:uncharacterized protein